MLRAMSPGHKPLRWLGLLALLFALAAGAGWLALPKLVLKRLETEAAKLGLLLSDCQLELSRDALLLTQCHFALADGRASGVLGRLDISLDGLSPSRVDAQDVALEIAKVVGHEGFAQIGDLDYATAELETLPIPVTVTGASVHFAPETGLEALRLSNLTLASSPARIEGEVALPLGIAGRFEADRKEQRVALRGPLPDSWLTAKARVVGSENADVTLELKALRVGWLLPLFEKPPPPDVADIQVDVQLQLKVPLTHSGAPARGDLRAAIRGLRFPAPPSVGALVASREVTVTGKLKIAANHKDFEASQLSVRAGLLTLRGSGQVQWGDVQSPLSAELRGSLACTAIVDAAARNAENRELATLAASLAKQALGGQVEIRVTAEGDARRLGQLRLTRSVVPGCGLKKELVQTIGDFLGEVSKQLPPAPGLPPLSELPSLSELPAHSELPKLRAPKLPDLKTFPLPGLGTRKLADGISEPQPGSALGESQKTAEGGATGEAPVHSQPTDSAR